MSRLFDRLDRLAARGAFDQIERLALEALKQAEGTDAKDLWRYVSWARFEDNNMRGALDAARRADDPLYRAKAHFHLWQFDEAREALAGFAGGGDDLAEANWYAGLIEEFTGGDPTEDFREAARLAPDLFPLKAALSDADVDAVVRGALAALPPRVARAIESTVIEVRPLPLPHPDVDPLQLGLYYGRSLMERSVLDEPMLPARIELYRANIERVAADREHAIDELRITLLHEVGHHLGFDEDGVAAMGLE